MEKPVLEQNDMLKYVHMFLFGQTELQKSIQYVSGISRQSSIYLEMNLWYLTLVKCKK